MNEQQWAHYLALLASHENATLWACVGCWYEQHPAGVAFPGDRVSSTLCQQHLITLPGVVKRPESLGHRSYAGAGNANEAEVPYEQTTIA